MSDWEVHYVKNRAGRSIAVGIRGAGPTLLCTPNSLVGSSFQRNEFLRPLHGLSRQLRIVTYDHVGAGMSDREGYEFTSEALLDELEAVTTLAGQGTFSIFGWGGGAHTAVRYAASHAERLDCMAIMGYQRGSDLLAHPPYRGYWEAMHTNWEAATEYVSLVWSQVHGDELRRRAAISREITSFEANVAYLEWMANSDIADLLGRVSVPTLVLQPRAHSYYPHQFGKDLAAGISGSRLVMVDYPGPDAFDPLLPFVIERAGGDVRAQAAKTDAIEALSQREGVVLALVAAGKSNAEIAEGLVIAEATAARHVHNILGKLGVANRTEAAAWWVLNGGQLGK